MSSTERKARLKEVDFSEGGSTRGVSTSSRVGRPDKRFEFAITSFSLFFFFYSISRTPLFVLTGKSAKTSPWKPNLGELD